MEVRACAVLFVCGALETMCLPSLATLPLDANHEDLTLRNEINSWARLVKKAHEVDSSFYYQIVYKGRAIGEMRWMPDVNNGVWSAALMFQRVVQVDGSERFNAYGGLGMGAVDSTRLGFARRVVQLLDAHGWGDVKDQIAVLGTLSGEE